MKKPSTTGICAWMALSISVVFVCLMSIADSLERNEPPRLAEFFLIVLWGWNLCLGALRLDQRAALCSAMDAVTEYRKANARARLWRCVMKDRRERNRPLHSGELMSFIDAIEARSDAATRAHKELARIGV